MASSRTAPRPLPAWPGVTEDYLDVGGRSVRILRAGSRDSGDRDREPQLLVHGLGGSAVTWVAVMAGLAARGPVVALDLPGFGRTETLPTDTYTVDAHLEAVLATADALGWERFALHGNSMGGLVGALLAAAHPERVSRLVLVSPALPPSSPLRILIPSRASITGLTPVATSSLTAAALGVLGAAAPVLDERRNRALLGLIFSDPEGVDPALLDLMAAEFADPDTDVGTARAALLRSLRSIACLWTDPRRVRRAVDGLRAPTLLLGGTADALVPARVLRQVAARRPDWQAHVLDERRHALMMESPAEYLDLVLDWQRARTAA